MGRLIIHIGTHKTGTTSIQRTLGANRKKLRNRGIRYPDYTSIGHGAHYAHIGAANAFAGEANRMSREDAQQFFAQAASTLDQTEVTLLSAESLYRHYVKDEDDERVQDPASYWAARSKFIASFREVVGPAEIAIVLRRQCDFAESMYQEHVKVTKYSRSFQSFLNEFWYHFDYYGQIQAWKAHFDAVKVLKFDAIKGDVITRKFLLQLGLKPGRFQEAGMTNIGIAPELVLVKRFLNGSRLSKDHLKRVMDVLSEAPVAAMLPEEKRHMFADSRHRIDFQDGFAEANAKIVAECFDGAGQLFAPLKPSADAARYGDDLDMQVCRLAVGDLVRELLD